MYWPRLRLTPEEHKYNSIYEDPGRTQYHVLRRIYPGFLNFSSVIRQDTDTLQIARRSRVFGFTASGDINLVEVQFSDITGELYTTDFIPLSALLGGASYDPRSTAHFNPAIVAAAGNSTGALLGNVTTYLPFIFEPNIVLAPNQTISVAGRPINPAIVSPLHVDFCFHVWEFPNPEMGSPL
jgi:hypothetical protein